MASGSKTKHEKEHMQNVADLGCIICKKMGFPDSPAELHHIKDKTGMGKKASHLEVIQKNLQKNGELKESCWQKY